MNSIPRRMRILIASRMWPLFLIYFPLFSLFIFVHFIIICAEHRHAKPCQWHAGTGAMSNLGMFRNSECGSHIYWAGIWLFTGRFQIHKRIIREQGESAFEKCFEKPFLSPERVSRYLPIRHSALSPIPPHAQPHNPLQCAHALVTHTKTRNKSTRLHSAAHSPVHVSSDIPSAEMIYHRIDNDMNLRHCY